MSKVFSKFTALLLALVVMVTLAGCAGQKDQEPAEEPAAEQSQKTLTLATTTSTQDSGLLDVLVPEFEQKTNIKVKVVAVGTGAAIKMGETGDADVLLVHARAAEDKFVNDGHGVNRKDVMHNDFVVVGPANDPVGIKAKPINEALKLIAEQGTTPFVSRGDDSGTHKKEKKLWEAAEITSQGDWYLESGSGMGDTLKLTNEKQGYTMSDRATYLNLKNDLDLEILVEKDDILLNPYGVIAVNQEKHEGVHYDEAMEFINFLVAPETQNIIKDYGVDKFGQPLFVPDAL